MIDLKISQVRCQFCHRTGGDVEQLISGDSSSICEDSVRACNSLLQPAGAELEQDQASERHLYQRLALHFAPLRPNELVATSRTYPLR